MGRRKPRTVRVDPEVWSAFVEQVIEWEGQKHGEIGRHVETALQEYIDNDRLRRVEKKVDRVLEAQKSQGRTRTHTTSETVEKVREIFTRLRDNHAKVIKDVDVNRAIEDIAGGDERTIEKYKEKLKTRSLLFEHPASDASVWTSDRDQWVKWAEGYINNNPTAEIHDVTMDYDIDTDEYERAVKRVVSHSTPS